MKFTAVASIALLSLNQVLAKPAEGCLQNYTITATDSCVSVAAAFELTEAEFYAMNPGLHHSIQHDCDNLDTGKPFCVCMQEPCVPLPNNASSTIPVSASDVLSSSSAIASSSDMLSSFSAVVASSSTSSVVAISTTSTSSSSSAATPAASGSSATPIASQSTQTTSAANLNMALGTLTLGLIMAACSIVL
ncbi:hypothetical protein CU098_013577 [Rhizopus stolonifer]|uniref:LysM domain-containing protein n=1 Tax=Rhizopus stolonifer TaxID=4846 RepID=A0A367KY97_RHIST|nr:hypothetical protein CU098_013577 [Rhizopus stolonifer]